MLSAPSSQPCLPAGGPLLFGSLYFAFILVIHECSHDMFVLTAEKSDLRRWNRRFGQLFSAPFFTDYIQHWEKGHVEHHLRPCEENDPQDRFPITGWPLAARLAALLFVPGSVLAFNPSNQYGFSVKRIGLGIVGLVVPRPGRFLVAWPAGVAILLGMHTLQIFNLLKKAQEHGGGLAHASDPAPFAHVLPAAALRFAVQHPLPLRTPRQLSRALVQPPGLP